MEASKFYNPLRVFQAISPPRHDSMKLLFPPGNLSESENETIRNRNTSFVTEMSEFLSWIHGWGAEKCRRLRCLFSPGNEDNGFRIWTWYKHFSEAFSFALCSCFSHQYYVVHVNHLWNDLKDTKLYLFLSGLYYDCFGVKHTI